MLFESTACCVVFQFIPDLGEDELLTKVPPYYDKLNSWLGQVLQLDAPQVGPIINKNEYIFKVENI